MKVLHLLFSNQYSGAENVVCQIVEMFRDVPNVEMVYCSRDGQIRDVLNERGITFAPISKLSFSEIRRVIREEKPDVIHAHDFLASVFACVGSGKIPVISHLHNNAPWMKSYGPPAIVYGMLCSRFKAVLCVSDSVFDEYVLKDKVKCKPIVVNNPVNINDIRMKADLKQCSDAYDISFCGRLTEQKNPLFLLDIVADVCKVLPDTSVVMMGVGELHDQVCEKIKQCALERNVKLSGFVSNPYPIMKNSKLMLFPSLWEGYGLVAVESIALGTPVVCSGVGGLSGIVNETCGKICTTKEEYVNEIVQLLSDKDYLAEKTANCAVRADELDNICEYRNMLQSVYMA